MYLQWIAGVLAVTGAVPYTQAAYCGSGPKPSSDNCNNAVAKLDPSGSYDSGTVEEAGDCSVSLSAGSLSGSDFISAAQDIINTCSSDGWTFVGDLNVNVSVSQCTVCMYGVCGVCDAPSRFKNLFKKEEEVVKPSKVVREAEAMTPTRPEKRNDTPAPGVTCLSGFAVRVSDCDEFADELAGQSLTLPYTGGNECSVAVEGTHEGATASGDDVGQAIRAYAALCASSGDDPVISEVVDNTHTEYDIYFGKLCNQFGFGTADCTTCNGC